MAIRTVALMLVVAGPLLFPPSGEHSTGHNPPNANVRHAAQLATGCRLYAMDHQGRFPAQLSELTPDYLPTDQTELLHYFADGSQRGADAKMTWLYFGSGHHDLQSLPVLIAAPIAETRRDHGVALPARFRVFAGTDCIVHTGAESDYQQALAGTVSHSEQPN